MSATNLKFNLIQNYLQLLKRLSPDSKLKLITGLTKSMKSKKKPSSNSINDLFGAFKSKMTAEELNADLKSSRKFKRRIEKL